MVFQSIIEIIYSQKLKHNQSVAKVHLLGDFSKKNMILMLHVYQKYEGTCIILLKWQRICLQLAKSLQISVHYLKFYEICAEASLCYINHA
jgi:hypothetical protein